MYEAKDVEILHKNLRENSQELLNPADRKLDEKRKSRVFENQRNSQTVAQKRRNSSLQGKAQQLPQHHKAQFSCLVDTILDFQLSEHERFLGKFLMLFQCIDTDNDGILTDDEFVELYDKMNNIDQTNQLQNGDDKEKFEQEISQFLDILDPYQCDKITLSDII